MLDEGASPWLKEIGQKLNNIDSCTPEQGGVGNGNGLIDTPAEWAKTREFQTANPSTEDILIEGSAASQHHQTRLLQQNTAQVAPHQTQSPTRRSFLKRTFGRIIHPFAIATIINGVGTAALVSLGVVPFSLPVFLVFEAVGTAVGTGYFPALKKLSAWRAKGQKKT